MTEKAQGMRAAVLDGLSPLSTLLLMAVVLVGIVPIIIIGIIPIKFIRMIPMMIR